MLKIKIAICLCLFTVVIIIYKTQISVHKPGDILDNYNGVNVYYNGNITDSFGRNKTKDGYNLGQKYQCVEFVKRYFYEVYSHKMPETYGHAKDFYNKTVADGDINKARDMIQFTNPSRFKPKVDDVVIFNGRYGHVAIITEVTGNNIKVVQQNVFAKTRDVIKLEKTEDKWYIDQKRILGRLRMK